MACSLFANWIWSRVGPEPDSDATVHVRLARELSDGTLEMLEARGKVETSSVFFGSHSLSRASFGQAEGRYSQERYGSPA